MLLRQLVDCIGHNCSSKAQVFRINTQIKGRIFLQGGVLFGMIEAIKWTK
jgi:hypothetical protein